MHFLTRRTTDQHFDGPPSGRSPHVFGVHLTVRCDRPTACCLSVSAQCSHWRCTHCCRLHPSVAARMDLVGRQSSHRESEVHSGLSFAEMQLGNQPCCSHPSTCKGFPQEGIHPCFRSRCSRHPAPCGAPSYLSVSSLSILSLSLFSPSSYLVNVTRSTQLLVGHQPHGLILICLQLEVNVPLSSFSSSYSTRSVGKSTSRKKKCTVAMLTHHQGNKYSGLRYIFPAIRRAIKTCMLASLPETWQRGGGSQNPSYIS